MIHRGGRHQMADDPVIWLLDHLVIRWLHRLLTWRLRISATWSCSPCPWSSRNISRNSKQSNRYWKWMTRLPAGMTFENIYSLESFILMHEHREIFLEILGVNTLLTITRSNDCELTFENIYNLELFILIHEHREICLIYKRVSIEILRSQLANRNSEQSTR